jgi:hypothetical protein
MSRPAAKITREELEGKFRAIQGGAVERATEAKATITQIAVGVGIVALILAFLLGQRRGKKRSAIVEIRRF